MAIPERVLDLLRGVGQVAAEVPASDSELVRAFVTAYRFRPEGVPGAAERYAYLGPREVLYRARRFRVPREVLESGYEVHEGHLWDEQSIVLPDEAALEFVLRLWLPDLDVLIEPWLTGVPT
jgi:hypothetical protein